MSHIYYVYLSYESFGRGYIGYRKCPLNHTPESDPYMGSYRDKTFKPTNKIILAQFDNDHDAITLEIKLHALYDVANNKDFANMCNQLSDKVKAPHSLSLQTRKKLSLLNLGENNPNFGRTGPSHWHYGKKLSESQKNKISEGLTGRPVSQETRDKIRQSNIDTLNKKAKKYTWVNTHDNSLEIDVSIMDMSRKYLLSAKKLRRCVKEGRCHNMDWVIKSQAQDKK